MRRNCSFYLNQSFCQLSTLLNKIRSGLACNSLGSWIGRIVIIRLITGPTKADHYQTLSAPRKKLPNPISSNLPLNFFCKRQYSSLTFLPRLVLQSRPNHHSNLFALHFEISTSVTIHQSKYNIHYTSYAWKNALTLPLFKPVFCSALLYHRFFIIWIKSLETYTRL